jgi:hypothetical protein
MCYIATVSGTPRVISEKPAVPTLWLDTSVVINFTRLAHGEALLSIELKRLTRLKTLLQQLVANGKLLCPQADQEEKYADRRLDLIDPSLTPEGGWHMVCTKIPVQSAISV